MRHQKITIRLLLNESIILLTSCTSLLIVVNHNIFLGKNNSARHDTTNVLLVHRRRILSRTNEMGDVIGRIKNQSIKEKYEILYANQI